MQKKSKYILPLLMLTLLAGCDKTNETPSQIPSEVPSDTAVTPSDKPSATVKPSVAPKIELTDARLKKYADSVSFEETEYEKVKNSYTAYSIEGAATKDKTITYIQYAGTSYEDPSAPAVPTKDEVKTKERRAGIYDEKKKIYYVAYPEGVSIDNTPIYKVSKNKYYFDTFCNPFSQFSEDDFDKNTKESTSELACYELTSITNNAKRSLCRFFALDHYEESLESFKLYINADSIVSYKLERVASDKNSSNTYSYVGKILSNDETTFKDDYHSALQGTPDADLSAALNKLNTATSFKERVDFTRSSGTESRTESFDNYVTPDLRKFVEDTEQTKEGSTPETEYIYRSAADKYYLLNDYGEKGKYVYGLEAPLAVKKASPLCFDKNPDGSYSIKTGESTNVVSYLTDYSYAFGSGLGEQLSRIFGGFPAVSSLNVTLDGDNIIFDGKCTIDLSIVQFDLEVKSTYSSYNTVIPDFDPTDPTKVHTTCDDLTWSDRLKSDANYSALTTLVGGEAALDAIPTPGQTLCQAVIRSGDKDVLDQYALDGDTLGTEQQGDNVSTIEMPTDAEHATNVNSYHRNLIVKYNKKLTAAGYNVTLAGTWTSLTATKGNQTVSVSFDNSQGVDLRLIAISTAK